MLTGTISLLSESFAIISVNGVGYKVFLPRSILTNFTKDQNIVLFTHTHVREDLLELYGFTNHEDLWLFEQLIGVSGVGCKTALGIFSIGTRAEIISAVTSADTSFFEMVPRLGKKNAQKIIIELRNKLGSYQDISLGEGSEREQGNIVKVLTSFGFSLKEARDALAATQGKAETTEERIRLSLKYLGK